MGGMHDGGVSALPPHRRRALSGPQREWLSLRPRSRARARAGARANFRGGGHFSFCCLGTCLPSTATRWAQSRLPKQLTPWTLQWCVPSPSFRPPARPRLRAVRTPAHSARLPLLQDTEAPACSSRAVLHAGAGAGAGAGADAGAGGKVRFPPLFFRCAHPAAPWGAR